MLSATLPKDKVNANTNKAYQKKKDSLDMWSEYESKLKMESEPKSEDEVINATIGRTKFGPRLTLTSIWNNKCSMIDPTMVEGIYAFQLSRSKGKELLRVLLNEIDKIFTLLY
ncbi:hypothetical protein RFI_01114 [Reticulomyxa filosa]|uniref:Uncharacterized protein n=1 Tax=Reticulomyxa filosa TaxID=46433 RepID=X6PCX7_RETFI|nr:hypothetical protein RFI_01114 [Reticulomyxa filosa]|eukprot:ETO35948.1 hypothetical protein RFI_01114 [Reticulomyxa filosa]